MKGKKKLSVSALS